MILNVIWYPEWDPEQQQQQQQKNIKEKLRISE